MADPLTADPDFEPLPPSPAPDAGEAPDFEPLPSVDGGDPDFEPLPSVQEVTDGENTRIGTAFKAGLQTTPDRRAGVLELARQTRVPADVIDKRYEDFQRTWQGAQFDPAKWRSDNPELAKVVLENPELAGVAMRDEKVSWLTKTLREQWANFSFLYNAASSPEEPPTPEGAEAVQNRLAGLEQKFQQDTATRQVPTITAPEAQATGFTRPFVLGAAEYQRNAQGLERSKLGFEILTREARGLDTWEQEKKATDLEQAEVARDYGQGSGEQLLLDAVTALPSQVESLKGMGVGGVVGGAVGLAVGAGVGALTRNPGAIAQGARVGAMKGMSIGAKAGTALVSFELESGSAYLEYRNMKTDDGQPISPAVARGAALAYGVVASAIETEAFGIELKAFGPLGEAVAAGNGKAFLAQALSKPAMRSTLAKVGAAWLKAGSAEGLEEFSQNIAKDVGGYFTRSVTARKLQKAEPVASIIEAAEAGRLGTIGGLALGAAGSSIHLTTQLMQDAKAQRAGQQVAALAKVADSPTVKAAPEAVAKMVADATSASGEPVTHLYVDPHAFTRLFQDEKADFRDAATQLLGPDGPQRLMEARVLGEKLEIPVGQYLEKWGPTEVGKRLAEDTTTSPALLTPRELREQDGQLQARAKELADQYAKEAPPTGAEGAWASAIEKQLIATKQMTPEQARKQAIVHRAFIRTQAERFGLDADQLFKDFEVKVLPPADTSFDFGPEGSGESGPAAPSIPGGTAGPTESGGLAAAPAEESSRLLEEAQGLIERMTSPEKKAMAQAWFDFTQGKTEQRPVVEPALERELARYGVVDPAGYAYDESGRSLERRVPGPRSGGQKAMPEELRRYRINNNIDSYLGQAEKSIFEQPAFHGTPHEFEKFTLQAIGSGEGAQAYGWGLYFAGKKQVAEYYRKTLSKPRLTLDGEPIVKSVLGLWVGGIAGVLAKDLQQYGRDEALEHAHSAALRDVREATKDLERLRPGVPEAERREAQDNLEGAKKALDWIRDLHNNPERVGLTGKGQTYNVEVPEHSELLDYDKRLSEQPAHAKEALASVWREPEYRVEFREPDPAFYGSDDAGGWVVREYVDGKMTDWASALTPGNSTERESEAQRIIEKRKAKTGDPTGAEIYESLSEALGSPQAASKALLAAGIPGLKYLDQISRGEGEGSHNYVIWDDKRVEMTGKLYQDEAPHRRGLEARATVEQSQAFRKWFGNSKVLDDNGKPRVVYHGSRASFDAFDKAKLGSATEAPSATQAFFFSGRPNTAESYTNFVLPQEKEAHNALFDEATSLRAQGWKNWARTKDPKKKAAKSQMLSRGDELFHQAAEMRQVGGNMMPVYLRMENPLVVDMKGKEYREQSYFDILQRAKADGHDGAIIKNTYDAVLGDALPDDIYAVFEPEQVKSAIGNRGTFDPNNPSILYQGEKDEHIKKAVAQHEERIRSQPVEHAVAVNEAGEAVVNKTSNHPSRVEFTKEEFDAMENCNFTHNHPRGFALSTDDLLVAMWANVKEMRAVRKDGSGWRVERPEVPGGWGFERNDLQRMRDDLARQQRGADMTARWRMDKIVTAAGGDPADGQEAKGFSHEEWTRIHGEESVKAFNAFSKLKEWGWQVEHFEPSSLSDEGRSAGVSTGPSEAGADGTASGGIKKLEQEKDSTARGYTEFAREGFKRIMSIALNESADLSTFLHESGHVFFEIFGDLAERSDAPESVQKDLNATLKWLGVQSRDELQVEHHEKWARAFEAYLMEGKSPSPELVGQFERFKLWLLSIYKSIKSLNVELNDDIRGVFDRLLATDEEIAATKRAMGLEQLFKSPEEAGMSPSQWQAYLQQAERATSTATRQAELRVLKDRLQATEAWWKEEETKERALAGHAYEELPARRALLHLQGKALDEEGNPAKTGEAIALNRAAVEEVVGKDGGKGLRLSKDGVHPDELAEVLGYPTGKAMLEALKALPEKTAWAKERATELMSEKHPEILSDKQKMRDLAAKGLHGDYTSRWLLQEWAALRKRAGESASTPVEAIERAATLIVERRRVGLLDAGGTLRTERTAALNAAKAAASGNFAQAAVFKQQQLLNMYLYRELMQAKEERDAFETLAGKLSADTSRARLGKASPIYRDGVDSLLEAFGLKAPEANRETPLPSLGDVVSKMEADGATVMFDEEALGKLLAKPRDWKDLSVGELRNVDGALKNIRAVARAVSTALVAGKREEKAAVVERLLSEAQKNLPSTGLIASSVSAETFAQKVGGLWSTFDGALLKPETMVRFLGGGSLESTWFQSIMQPLQEAKHREVDILEKTIEPLLHTWEKMPDRGNELVDGQQLFPNHRPDVPAPTRRFELLMMALNAGNESNLSRLLEGRNITMEQLTGALNLLTKEELDWVQAVWDAAESLWPEARALEERDSGLAPPKMQAKPLKLQNGTLKGGYFPAVYDRRIEAAGERQVANNIAALMDPSFTRPGTSRSHLKSRVEGFTGAISLEPSAIPAHLAQVAHDIAFREAVKSVGGLVLNPDVQAVLKDRLGDGRAKTFLQWMKDVGQMRGAGGFEHAGALLKIARKLKANTVIAALGFAVPNAIEDLSNIPAALSRTELKARHLAPALSQFLLSPFQSIEDAKGKSGELRARHTHLQRELAAQARAMTKGPLAKSFPGRMLGMVKEHAFVLMEASDAATSTPVWMGAYRQGLAEGKADSAAVTFADSVVRQVFPSHSAVDTAAILRDKGFVGTSLMFYGFLSTAYNGAREILHPLHTADGAPETAARLPQVGARLLAYIVTVSVLSEFLRGRGREGDEDWSQWFMRKMMAGSLALLPGGGDAANFIEAKMMGKRSNPRNQSLVGIGAGVAEAAGRVVTAVQDGDEVDKRVTSLLQSLGPLVGLPTVQPVKTGKYLLDLAKGDAEARNPADVAGGLIYGQREGQPETPLKLVGDAISGPR